MILRSLLGLLELSTAWLPQGRVYSICELGNQCMRADGRRASARSGLTKMGYVYTSIDINGEDGALPLDLSLPIPQDMVGKGAFDIVTNFGTIEHVENDRMAFQNMHDLCRAEGLMVHALPKEGTYKGHGLRRYSVQFLQNLARTNNYITLLLLCVPVRPKDVLVCAILQRVGIQRFHWIEEE